MSKTVQLNTGGGLIVIHNVREYELMDLQAGVYHKLLFDDGSTLYVNDFGVKSVHVLPEGKTSTFAF